MRRVLILVAVFALAVLAGAAVVAGPAAAAGSTGAGAAGSGGSAAGSGLLPPASTSPLSPGLPQAPATTPTATATAPTIVNSNTSTAGNSGLSGSGITLIVIGAVVLLGGISFFIWRDARRRAPVKAAARSGGTVGANGSRPNAKRQPKPRKLSPAERKRRKRGRAP